MTDQTAAILLISPFLALSLAFAAVETARTVNAIRERR